MESGSGASVPLPPLPPPLEGLKLISMRIALLQSRGIGTPSICA